MNLLHVIRRAFWLGARDYTAIFTWKTWLTNWFVRVIAQVSFFALVGRMLGAPGQTQFLLVGNAVMLAAMVGMWAVNMVNCERSAGTLPLLAASPTHPAVVLAARGSYLIVDATLSASGALLVTAYLFGMPLPWPRVAAVIALIAVVATSTFCFGTLAGSLLLGFRSIETIVTNVGLVALMTLCGVNVPLDFYPEPVRWVSSVLPLTHGLVAVRHAVAGELRAALLPALLEALVGAGWLTVCLLIFTTVVRRGRRHGTLDYAS
ncbi:ABC transporter permease (plasmid) [Streptomyces sp. NBC_01216]|uniref:ABC transporter permease n=1 Tax=Streptomyces sp. NBC_01216 TaxID=2903778 RepID=UPI002E11F56E|nr:ABC transporter permease [Streptomyces sp. NBC_01216]